MTKKHFIALADALRVAHNRADNAGRSDLDRQFITESIANVCEKFNRGFNRQRWLDYIAGKRGPSGRKVHQHQACRFCGECVTCNLRPCRDGKEHSVLILSNRRQK